MKIFETIVKDRFELFVDDSLNFDKEKIITIKKAAAASLVDNLVM